MSKKMFALVMVFVCMAMGVVGCGNNDNAAKDATANELPPVESAVIGTMLGSVNEPLVAEKFPNAEVKGFKNYEESFKALGDEAIDYAIMDYATALNFARHHENVTMLSEPLSDEVTAMALNPNTPEMNKEIKEIVARYIADGTMDEIISHWIKEDGSDYDIPTSVAPTEGETLRIAITTATEPRCFMIEQKPAGMIIELMDNICAELGMVPQYQDMAFGEMMEGLKNDQCDVIPAMYQTPEREEFADFTEGYFPNPQVFLVLAK